MNRLTDPDSYIGQTTIRLLTEMTALPIIPAPSVLVDPAGEHLSLRLCSSIRVSTISARDLELCPAMSSEGSLFTAKLFGRTSRSIYYLDPDPNSFRLALEKRALNVARTKTSVCSGVSNDTSFLLPLWHFEHQLPLCPLVRSAIAVRSLFLAFT